MCVYQVVRCEDCNAWIQSEPTLVSICERRARARQPPHSVNNTEESRTVTNWSLHSTCRIERKTNDPDDPYNKSLCWWSHKGQLCSARRRGTKCSRNPEYNANANP